MSARKTSGRRRKPRQTRQRTPEQAKLLAELKVLAERPADEWVRLIEQLEDVALRNHVGCIVWWDYFAQYKRANPAFSRYLDAWKVSAQCDSDKLIAGLQRLGYPLGTAVKRVAHGT